MRCVCVRCVWIVCVCACVCVCVCGRGVLGLTPDQVSVLGEWVVVGAGVGVAIRVSVLVFRYGDMD